MEKRTQTAVEQWVDAYERAWTSNDPSEIAALFVDDAEYLTSPWSPPRKGREAIVAGWLADRDEPGTWTFDWDVLATQGNVAIVRGRTAYVATANGKEGAEYANLWLIELVPDGRASRFEEWWIERPVVG